jgi:hypothetical protein
VHSDQKVSTDHHHQTNQDFCVETERRSNARAYN